MPNYINPFSSRSIGTTSPFSSMGTTSPMTSFRSIGTTSAQSSSNAWGNNIATRSKIGLYTKGSEIATRAKIGPNKFNGSFILAVIHLVVPMFLLLITDHLIIMEE